MLLSDIFNNYSYSVKMYLMTCFMHVSMQADSCLNSPLTTIIPVSGRLRTLFLLLEGFRLWELTLYSYFDNNYLAVQKILKLKLNYFWISVVRCN